jgi:hypothetical protein
MKDEDDAADVMRKMPREKSSSAVNTFAFDCPLKLGKNCYQHSIEGFCKRKTNGISN